MSRQTGVQTNEGRKREILNCTRFIIILLLLMLEIQPTMGFSLLGDFLPFRPFLTQFSPLCYSHRLDIFLNIFNPAFPWSTSDSPTHSNILLGILLPSIRITCPSQAILLLFVNLTMSAFPMNSCFIIISKVLIPVNTST